MQLIMSDIVSNLNTQYTKGEFLVTIKYLNSMCFSALKQLLSRRKNSKDGEKSQKRKSRLVINKSLKWDNNDNRLSSQLR